MYAREMRLFFGLMWLVAGPATALRDARACSSAGSGGYELEAGRIGQSLDEEDNVNGLPTRESRPTKDDEESLDW